MLHDPMSMAFWEGLTTGSENVPGWLTAKGHGEFFEVIDCFIT